MTLFSYSYSIANLPETKMYEGLKIRNNFMIFGQNHKKATDFLLTVALMLFLENTKVFH